MTESCLEIQSAALFQSALLAGKLFLTSILFCLGAGCFIRSTRSGFRGRHAEAFEDNEDDMDAALDSMENADEEREAKEQEGANRESERFYSFSSSSLTHQTD